MWWKSQPRKNRLDPWTQNVEIGHADDLDQHWRFRACGFERSRWRDLLSRDDAHAKILNRFNGCGQQAWVVKDPKTNRHFIQCTACKLRICPACRAAKSDKAQRKIADLLKDAPPSDWQFVTLTMRHSQAPLVDQLKNLRESFRRLRQRKLWKTAVDKCYGVIEVTYNEERKEWHPHLHVLSHTRFLDWSKLRSDWCKCSGGANVIDVQKLKPSRQVVQYITGYLGKPPSLAIMQDLELLDDWREALNYGRFLIKAGKWPKPPEPAATEPKERSTHVTVAKLSDVIRNAHRGDPAALAVLRLLVAHRGKNDDAATSASDVLARFANARPSPSLRELAPLDTSSG